MVALGFIKYYLFILKIVTNQAAKTIALRLAPLNFYF